jgi:Fuc2NAc and GlcNAc transferase
VVIAVDVPWIARWAIVSFGAFWLIATTNIYNFMDGIDGLAATEGIFISGALLLLSHLSGGQHAIDAVLLAACGANMGFLYWNWPPARIFMGDVGSGFLGFVLGCCGLLLISEGVSTAAVLIVFAAFLVDSSITLVRRVLRRERWYSAHRTHAYQQLARAWGSHRSVTLVVAAINVFWLLPLAAWATILPETSARAIALAFGPLVFGCVAAGAGRALKFLG